MFMGKKGGCCQWKHKIGFLREIFFNRCTRFLWKFLHKYKIERHFKEVSITELKEIITKKKQESDKNK
jgi:hypothetical protein